MKNEDRKDLAKLLFVVPPDFDKANSHGQAVKLRYYNKKIDREKCSCF